TLQSMSETEPCQFCGDDPAEKECSVASCSRKRLCLSCDNIWHGHPARKDHHRIDIQQSATHTGLNSVLSSDGRQSNFPTIERDPGQPMRERDSGQPMRERDSGQPMRERDFDQPMKERNSDKPIRQRDSGQPMRERDFDQPNIGQHVNPVNKRNEDLSVGSHNSGQATGIPWTCAHCTAINDFNCNSDTTKNDRLTCQVCSKTSSLADVVESVKAFTGKVLCVKCTLLNDSHSVKCDGCDKTLVAVPIQGASSARSQPSEYSSGGAVANDYSRPFFKAETAHYDRTGDSAGHEAAARNTDVQSATSSVLNGGTDGDTLEDDQCPKCTFKNRLTATVCEMCDAEIQPASHLSVVRNRSSGEFDRERHGIDDRVYRLMGNGLSYEQACRAASDQVDDTSVRPTEFSSSAKEIAGVVPETFEPAVCFACCKCLRNVKETDPFEVKICGCKICMKCFCKAIEISSVCLGALFCFCSRALKEKRDRNEHYSNARLQIRQKLGDAESASILERFEQKLSDWRQREGFSDPSAAVKYAPKFFCRKCHLDKDLCDKIGPPTCSCSVCQDCFSTDVFRKLVDGCCDKYKIKCPACYRCFLSSTSDCSKHAKWLEDCIWASKSTNLSISEREIAVKCLRLLASNPGSSVASGHRQESDFRSEYLHRDLPQNSSLQLVGDCGHGLRPASNGYLWCKQCCKFACPTCKRVTCSSSHPHKFMY
ncbi:hypothetical protein BOX15_Mlig005926g1, partial [Macrostomum lignano]